MKNNQITLAAIIAPGKALFGADLLDITSQAWDLGVNLTGAQIRKAWPADGGGVWVESACEAQHYGVDGKIDN